LADVFDGVALYRTDFLADGVDCRPRLRLARLDVSRDRLARGFVDRLALGLGFFFQPAGDVVVEVADQNVGHGGLPESDITMISSLPAPFQAPRWKRATLAPERLSRRRLMRTPLILAVALVLATAPAAAQQKPPAPPAAPQPAVPSPYAGENLLVKMPDGYKVGFSTQKDSLTLVQMVPQAESVQGWTEMVTVQIF